MKRNRILSIILLGAVLLGILQVACYHGRLPDQVAVHFNLKGEADRYSTPVVHSVSMVTLQVGMAAFLFGISVAIRYLPANLINLPNREYWLSDERREATVGRIQWSLLVMAIATQLFLVTINQLVTLQNLGQDGMRWFWPVFAMYMVFIFGFCIWMMIHFQVPANSDSNTKPWDSKNGDLDAEVANRSVATGRQER